MLPLYCSHNRSNGTVTGFRGDVSPTHPVLTPGTAPAVSAAPAYNHPSCIARSRVQGTWSAVKGGPRQAAPASGP